MQQNRIFMNFRAKDAQGVVLAQDYNGQCWAWLHQGRDITIERGTGRLDRHQLEIFEGDRVYMHYKDKSVVTVKFGEYSDNKLTQDIFTPHYGFYVEDNEGDQGYLSLIASENGEIVSAVH
jgi:hypothetical protein